MDQEERQGIVDTTRRWIAEVVIGLNLCPFARRVFEGEKIRYVVTFAEDEGALRDALAAEILALASPDSPAETTLLIHPRVLGDFLDYNDFLDSADRLLVELGQRGIVQIASFHPEYQFAGTRPDDAENYTNRSPYPLLHLLREESITAAVAGSDQDELLAIPERNIETMNRLGHERIRAMLRGITNEDV